MHEDTAPNRFAKKCHSSWSASDVLPRQLTPTLACSVAAQRQVREPRSLHSWPGSRGPLADGITSTAARHPGLTFEGVVPGGAHEAEPLQRLQGAALRLHRRPGDRTPQLRQQRRRRLSDGLCRRCCRVCAAAAPAGILCRYADCTEACRKQTGIRLLLGRHAAACAALSSGPRCLLLLLRAVVPALCQMLSPPTFILTVCHPLIARCSGL